jgi:hypothetical protein
VPKIEFHSLPPEIGRHLAARIRERQITAADVERLQAWVRTAPEAPAGDWYKDFGSFKLCGTGPYPKTVLTARMRPYGEEIP